MSRLLGLSLQNEPMNKEEFINAIRRGKEAKFRVDDIVITHDAGQIKGKGMLEAGNGRFRLNVILNEGFGAPETKTGIKVEREFWNIAGKIEDQLDFRMRGLSGGSSLNYVFGQPTKSFMNFSVGHLELAPMGFESLTSSEVEQLLDQASGNPSPGAEPVAQTVNIKFFAVLPNFKLVEKNGGTETKCKNDFLGESGQSSRDTFKGELPGWDYGLVERDGDLHVYFNSKPEHRSEGQEHDWRLFYAFLNALAFTHGQHFWPFEVQHSRDGKLVTHRISLHKGIAKSPHAPFTEQLSFDNQMKHLTWSFGDALNCAFKFFNSESQLARETETVLYTFREATASGVPKRIALLTLCSLFESLIRAIYEEKIAPQKTLCVTEFQAAKKDVCATLRGDTRTAYKRLADILAPVEPVNNRMRYQAVSDFLGLKPEEYWKELFEMWKDYRNPMSHRMAKTDASEESVKGELIAESQIAGAINCLILKLMDYSGYLRLSAFEDKYGQI